LLDYQVLTSLRFRAWRIELVCKVSRVTCGV
jgi:hypothetical protein